MPWVRSMIGPTGTARQAGGGKLMKTAADIKRERAEGCCQKRHEG